MKYYFKFSVTRTTAHTTKDNKKLAESTIFNLLSKNINPEIENFTYHYGNHKHYSDFSSIRIKIEAEKAEDYLPILANIWRKFSSENSNLLLLIDKPIPSSPGTTLVTQRPSIFEMDLGFPDCLIYTPVIFTQEQINQFGLKAALNHTITSSSKIDAKTKAEFQKHLEQDRELEKRYRAYYEMLSEFGKKIRELRELKNTNTELYDTLNSLLKKLVNENYSSILDQNKLHSSHLTLLNQVKKLGDDILKFDPNNSNSASELTRSIQAIEKTIQENKSFLNPNTQAILFGILAAVLALAVTAAIISVIATGGLSLSGAALLFALPHIPSALPYVTALAAGTLAAIKYVEILALTACAASTGVRNFLFFSGDKKLKHEELRKEVEPILEAAKKLLPEESPAPTLSQPA